MHVSVKGRKVDIDTRTFKYLFENSPFYEHEKYLAALEDEHIGMAELIELARGARINYALFFVRYDEVTAMVEKENKKIFQGFGGNFTLSVRGKRINLNLLRMVIKDLRIKQSFVARYLQAPKNSHPRRLVNTKLSASKQAEYILSALEIDMATMRGKTNTKTAMMYLIDRLQEQNILVALEAQTNMPQNMQRAKGISGVYIKDGRFPYLFIANESQANFDQGAGRKIFTIMYLLVCMFKGKSRMVSLEETIGENASIEPYEIVEEMLMPKEEIVRMGKYTLDDIDKIAAKLHVSPRAVLVRLRHLDYLADDDTFWSLMNSMQSRYAQYVARQKKEREQKNSKFVPNVAANIMAYHGKAFLGILKNLHSSGKLSQRQLNIHLAYGRYDVKASDAFKRVR